MAEVKLSILVPITPERFETVQPLLSVLGYTMGLTSFLNHGNWLKCWVNRVNFETELWIYNDNKEITLGEKREILYKAARGKYSIQVDSDDLLAPNAIELILKAIDENPDVDCITFEELCDMNGTIKRSNHALKYEKWQDNFDGFDYVRSPFYKNIIKTSIAQSVPFPHVRYNEDEQFSMALRPHLKTEVHIDEQLYYYIYNSQAEDFNERYGIK